MKCIYLSSIQEFYKMVYCQESIFGRSVIDQRDNGLFLLDHNKDYQPLYAILFIKKGVTA